MQSLLSKQITKSSMLSLRSLKVLSQEPVRMFGKDLLSDKEKGDETIFFSKQDCKLFV